ncbi:MAG: hypothetical protein IJ600_09580 [Lachnospiraceae bacterium]|nr:hypothetical protein [Lachnospiraceae bacterium]
MNSEGGVLQRLAEIQAAQEEIIMLQGEVIDDLFRLLMRHINADEMKDELEKINRAAMLKKELDF